EHVSRPPNAFMVYRSYVWFTKQLDDNDEKNLSCVSKLAADSWKDMNDQARAPFHSVAALAKRKHAELYPDYKYAP
ncbi:high mobility group box domain-containing protein, partial [Lactifluus volemus]